MGRTLFVSERHILWILLNQQNMSEAGIKLYFLHKQGYFQSAISTLCSVSFKQVKKKEQVTDNKRGRPK